MKFFLAALPLLVQAEDLLISDSLDGTALHSFTQLGGGVACLTNATADAALGKTGGEMDFLSDSLEMCAIACNCRQSCISFNWVKPDTFDGTLNFVLPLDIADVGDQGKCTLRSSDCEGDFAEVGGANEYAFQRTSKIATDVSAVYPRQGAESELEVTNQVNCVLQSMTDDSGYFAIGHGGPGAGVCASGGKTAKLTDLDDQAPSNTGLAACRDLCNGHEACNLFNLLPDGSCKFRNQCCETFWSAETAKKGWTSYAASVCAIMPTSSPTSSPTGGDSPASAPSSAPVANTTFSKGSRTYEIGLAVSFTTVVATAIHVFY